MFSRFFKRPSKRREQSPPTISDLVRRPCHDSIPTLEPLEPRVLLSGTTCIVDSLNDIVNNDNHIVPIEVPVHVSTGIDVEHSSQTEDLHAFDFGTLGPGQTASETFTVRNQGLNTLTITEAIYLRTPFILTPYNSSDQTDNWVILPGETFDFTVTFDTDASYAFSDTLVLVSDDPNQPNYSIVFTGTKILPVAHYVVNSLLTISADDGLVTLPEALTAAYNNSPTTSDVPPGSHTEFDRISFDPALFSSGPATIAFLGSGYSIRGDLIIQGPGSDLLTLIASDFGSIFNIREDSNVHIEDLTFVGVNRRALDNSGSLTLTRTTVTGSRSTPSGGISNSGDLTITDSTISGNVGYNGGGIDSGGSLTLINATVANNTAIGIGGGIYAAGTTTIVNSIISGNTAHGRGGGINFQSGTLSVTQSIITGNTTDEDGAGIDNRSGAINLTHTTLAGNVANGQGRGVHNESGSLTLNNTIIALNKSDHQAPDILGSVASYNSLIGIDPGFRRNPSPGADGLWGTADDDHGDLRLADTSIAINLGTNALAVDDNRLPLTADLNGNPRVADSQVDIGAYEFQGAPGPLREAPSPTATILADIVDPTDNLISLREAIIYAPALGMDPNFHPDLSRGVITLNGEELRLYNSLNIDATPIGGLTIDADRQSRVLAVSKNVEVTLTELTLTGGLSTSDGGGISNGGNLTLNNTTVSGNATESAGGGVDNQSGTLTLIHAVVSGNSAGVNGGGILNSGTLTATYSSLKDNTSGEFGGAVYSNNTATLANTIVARNTAHHGGGVYNTSDMTVTNSIFVDNTATFGGGILANNGNLTLNNATVVANLAIITGGGIYRHHSATVTLNNSIATLNNAVNPNNLANTENDIYGAVNIFNSLVGESPGFVRNPSAGLDEAWGTADDDFGDLRLLPSPTNPAIDAGDNTRLPADTLDLDGDLDTIESLPIDFAGNIRINGTAVDIGAYEAVPIITGVIDVELPGQSDNVHAYDFGTVHGDQIGTATFTLRNEGNNVLSVNKAYTLESFFQINPTNDHGAPDDWQIQPGGTMELTVSFRKPVAGLYTDTLVLSSDDAYQPVYQIALTANQTLPATQYTVDSLLDVVADDGFVTLREALEAANSNTTITADLPPGSTTEADLITFHPSLFAAGPATLTLNGAQLEVTDDLIIQGPGADLLTVDANGNSRVFFIKYYAQAHLVGLTITGGSTVNYNTSSQPKHGGGIWNYGATLTLSGVNITGNSANDGGGIYTNGSLTLDNSNITNNSATHGGGIWANGPFIIINSDVSSNTATNYGGGIRARAIMTVINLTLRGNTAGEGGGIYADFGTATLTNTVMVGNTANNGGGIYNLGANITLINSTLASNNAGETGGGINTAPQGLTTLANTIVALNTASTSPDVHGVFTKKNTRIGGNPRFVLNPFQGADNIWGTPDDDYGDLHLLPNSPAINTGSNNLLPPNTPFDITGAPRIFDSTVDIGAHENIQPLPSLPGDINGDESIDITDVDLLSLALNTNNPNSLYDLNSDQQLTPTDGQYLVQDILNTFFADFDLDYRVDVADLSTWATGFGQTGALFSQGDANFDGQIDVTDLSIWATNFGNTSTPPAPITAPLTQSSNAISDTFILDTTSSASASTINPTSPPNQDGRWDNITNLISNDSTKKTNRPLPVLDVIKSITRII